MSSRTTRRALSRTLLKRIVRSVFENGSLPQTACEPGVRSARYAGEPSNTPNNNALLLKNLKGAADRRANFTCAVALVGPDGREHTVVGKCFGRIAEEPSGAAGFGYDPLFVPDGHSKSFAELTAEEKNAISHRGRALASAREILEGKRARSLCNAMKS